MSGEKPESALREAARWYAELQDEAAGPELWRRFLAWERRPGNAAAFRQIEASLTTLDRAQARGGERRPRRPAWPIGAGLAAALLLVVLGGAHIAGREAAPVATSVIYATEIGAQQTVKLEDGSELVLNTASQARVTFSAAERRVDLLSGQALFEVRREARPFVVAAGGTETRALGTRFEVYLPAGDGVQVTLIEGLVNVSGLASGGSVLLSPGEQLQVRAGAPSVARVDTARAGAWTAGMVAFTDATLAEAAAELNRYSAVRLLVEGEIAGARISGSFRAGDQEAFVAALEAFLPVAAERRGGEIVIRSRD